MKQNWEIKKLGEVCNFQGGSQPPKEEWINYEHKDYIRMLQIRDFTQSRNAAIEYVKISDKLRFCNSDDILLGRYGASVGKVLTGLSGAYNVAIMKTIPSDIISKSYIKYYFVSSLFQNPLSTLCNSRAAQAGFSREDIFDFPIPVPPLADQLRIVAILDAKFAQIDALKAAAQKNLDNAEQLWKAQLEKEFGNKEWKMMKLGECGSFKNGMNFNSTDTGYSIHSLGVGDFKNHFQINDTSTLPIISLKSAPNEDYLLQNEDIVFVRSNGNKELVGRCVITYPNDIKTTYSGFCIRFRNNYKGLNVNFLTHYLKTETIRKKIRGNNGTNISNLNQKILSNLEIPIPSLAEQTAIVSRLDALSAKISDLKAKYCRQIECCDELRQSLLREAFEGEM